MALNKKTGVIFLILMTTVTFSLATINPLNSLIVSSDPSVDKVITLNSNNSPTNSFEYVNSVTYTGISNATFTYTKVKAAAGALCTLNENGTLKKDRANGLKTITINFDGSLELQTGFTESYDETKTLTQSNTYSVCGNFFKLTALEETTINSLIITFSCLYESTSHNYGNWYTVTPSTHSVRGVEEHACTICGHREQKSLPLLEATGLTILTPPTKTSYDEGEYFDPSGMEIALTYEDNSTRTIANYSYSPNGVLTEDVTTIVITYEDFVCYQPITVTAVPLRIEVTTAPTKTLYVQGEDLDTTGMVVSKIDRGVETILDESEYSLRYDKDLRVGSIPTVVLEENTDITTRVPVFVQKEIDITVEDHLAKTNGSTAGYQTTATLKATATNGNYLMNFVENDVLNITFKSQSAGKAGLFIKSASTYVTEYSSVSNKTWYYPTKTGDVQANKLFEIYINNVRIDIPDSVIFEGSETEDDNGNVLLLAVWKNVEMNNVDVVHGTNTIQIKFLKQIYKNADVTVDNKTKIGVLSSPVIDTATIRFNCSGGIHTTGDHDFTKIVKRYSNLAKDKEGPCSELREYYYICSICEMIDYNHTFTTNYNHNFEYVISEDSITSGSTTTQHMHATCTICGEEVTGSHETATIGVLKNNASYSSGDDLYFDLGSANIIGTNDINGITDSFAKNALNAKGDRGTAVVQSSGSTNVEKALNKACGHDYLSYFYNGAGVEVSFNATQEETKMIVIKAASGYIVGNDAFCTADMQFNLIFDVYHNNRLIDIPDSAILYGKDGHDKNGKGDYGVAHANWTYIAFDIVTTPGTNTIQLISKAPYASNDNVLYYDIARSGNNTMSSARIDTIAIY